MKRWTLLTIVAIISSLFIASIIIAETQTSPDVIFIDKTVFKKRLKKGVKFSHKKHIEEYKIACTECHHNYKDGKNVWKEGDPVKKCETCHDPVKSKGKQYKLQLAFHNNCQKCHKKLRKEGKSKKAPVKCTQCHGKGRYKKKK